MWARATPFELHKPSKPHSPPTKGNTRTAIRLQFGSMATTNADKESPLKESMNLKTRNHADDRLALGKDSSLSCTHAVDRQRPAKHNRFMQNLHPSCSQKVWVFSSSLDKLKVLVPAALVSNTLLATCSSPVAST